MKRLRAFLGASALAGLIAHGAQARAGTPRGGEPRAQVHPRESVALGRALGRGPWWARRARNRTASLRYRVELHQVRRFESLVRGADEGDAGTLRGGVRTATAGALARASRLAGTRTRLRGRAVTVDLRAARAGERLGSGTEKDVHAVLGDPTRVIGWQRDPTGAQRLHVERELLDEIRGAGYPAARMDVGPGEGQPLVFVSERFGFFSRDIVGASAAELRRHVTLQTVGDLEAIAAVSRATGTAVLDLQYGIDADGRVRVVDPRNFYHGGVAGHAAQRLMLLQLDLHIARMTSALGLPPRPSVLGLERSAKHTAPAH